MALLELKNIQKTYTEGEVETQALSGVDLHINAGEFIAIIGPSGSGKSTLLQILGCLDRASGGSYKFDGKELRDYTDDELAAVRSTQMGFVFQSFNLLPRLTVLENVQLPLAYAGVAEPERTNRALKFIEMVGLSDRAQYATSKLSGGQKQRVAIARALVNNPKVIFADEPTGSLDSKSGETILQYLETLNQKGCTIVLVTHETYVAKTAKRIVTIRDGHIEFDEQIIDRRSAFDGSPIK